jgi:hypothetical protein
LTAVAGLLARPARFTRTPGPEPGVLHSAPVSVKNWPYARPDAIPTPRNIFTFKINNLHISYRHGKQGHFIKLQYQLNTC